MKVSPSVDTTVRAALFFFIVAAVLFLPWYIWYGANQERQVQKEMQLIELAHENRLIPRDSCEARVRRILQRSRDTVYFSATTHRHVHLERE